MAEAQFRVDSFASAICSNGANLVLATSLLLWMVATILHLLLAAPVLAQ